MSITLADNALLAPPRYSLLRTIAAGSFAMVYHAYDQEVGRDVAIKEIHPQFLTDQGQLTRYWQEARLLASLQHPNVLTIYDVVRLQGWLVLERMQGSLQRITHTEGIDVDYLRVVLLDCLQAMQFLHANGVIHGDIKPSNLLVDTRGRVKVGDFGLARRINGDAGSLLKGTTKYMAPEVASDQFGSVGPASDLYSLGFVAYELLCGSRFELLFPGLSAFGRDTQVAWMMWHTALDRRLPEIRRTLEGVPDRLATVIERLTAKDQTQRYDSADAVLDDLISTSKAAAVSSSEDAKSKATRVAAAKKLQRRRYGLTIATALSIVLCVAVMIPASVTPPPVSLPPVSEGVITAVDAEGSRLTITGPHGGKRSEMRLDRDGHVFLNDRSCQLRDLRPDDRFHVKIVDDESGRQNIAVYVTRPIEHAGRVKALQLDQRQMVLAVEAGESRGQELIMNVPIIATIALNGQAQNGRQPVTLANLQPGDYVVAHSLDTEKDHIVTDLTARRAVTLEGILQDVDPQQNRLTVLVGSGGRTESIVLPWADECEVMLNGHRFLKPTDLSANDKTTVTYDTHIRRIVASRISTVTGVVRNIKYAARTLEVVSAGAGEEGGEPKAIDFAVPSSCKIQLDSENVAWDILQNGDRVEIGYESPSEQTPEALRLLAQRPTDPNRWALLVGIQNYDDHAILSPACSAADALLLRDVLVKRNRVPASQVQLSTNDNLPRLQHDITNLLGRITKEGNLIAYFSGRAFQDSEGHVFVATKDTNLGRLESTAMPLQWLVDQLEKCPAKEKLLLLDSPPADANGKLAAQLSTEEVLRTLQTPSQQSPLRTVTAMASCRKGQRGLLDPEKQHGLFAWSLAGAFSGKADENHDNQLEANELFKYLSESMAVASGSLHTQQVPQLLLPDNRPPRMTEEAKQAIRAMATGVRHNRVDVDESLRQYQATTKLANGQPEPKIILGLLLLKAKERDTALKHFEQLKAQQPDLLLSWQATAWLRFESRAYTAGVEELTALATKVTKNSPNRYPREVQEMFHWMGELREYAALAAPDTWRPSPLLLASLDAAVSKHGESMRSCYQQGRSQVQDIVRHFDEDAEAATDDAAAAKIKINRRQILHYARFPIESMVQRCLAGLDR